MNTEIKDLPISQIKPAEYNPRSISPRALKGLKRSITEFGQRVNLIVNSDMTLISGHQRLKAMEELGFTEATCFIIDVDKTTEKKLNITLNNPHLEGKFDQAKLDIILDELIENEFGGYDDMQFYDLESAKWEEPDIDDSEIQDSLDRYEQNSIKSIIFIFDADKFEEIYTRLDKAQAIAEEFDNSKFFLQMLNLYEDHRS